MNSSLQFNLLRYATILLVCWSHITAQPPIQPASMGRKVVDSNGVCTIDNAFRLQLANKAGEILNSSILPQLHGLYRYFSASSCVDIYLGHPSG